MTAGVALIRGDVRESYHRLHLAVHRIRPREGEDAGAPEAAATEEVASAGNSSRSVYLRSCAKPFQALPLVEEGVADQFDMTGEELAICCASHSGEARHLEVVAALLSRIEAGPDALECGVRPPLRAEAAEEVLRRGEAYGPLHNNCSGKHAGMLALARHEGWPGQGYSEPNHPVQRRMASEIARWARHDPEEIPTGIDGCGVLTFALSLGEVAGMFARLGAAAARGEEGPRRIVGAMTAHPFLVGGTNRLDTEVMEVAGDRLFVKSGAEGMICAGVPDRGLGIALKIEDGSARAVPAAFLTAARALGILDGGVTDELLRGPRTVVTDTRDRPAGRLSAEGLEGLAP